MDPRIYDQTQIAANATPQQIAAIYENSRIGQDLRFTFLAQQTTDLGGGMRIIVGDAKKIEAACLERADRKFTDGGAPLGFGIRWPDSTVGDLAAAVGTAFVAPVRQAAEFAHGVNYNAMGGAEREEMKLREKKRLAQMNPSLANEALRKRPDDIVGDPRPLKAEAKAQARMGLGALKTTYGRLHLIDKLARTVAKELTVVIIARDPQAPNPRVYAGEIVAALRAGRR